MAVSESGSSSSYDAGLPWVFKGSALYQLHLVKAETARAFIPKEFRLVEAFGYNLGGLFLAHYDDSPAGVFDELVVIAGIVWNLPTSCAWAARVLVNSHEACKHGRKYVGLPSHVATFSKQRVEIMPEKPKSKYNHLLTMMGVENNIHRRKEGMEIQVTEINDSCSTAFCNINLKTAEPGSKLTRQWRGPPIRMSLPSFRIRPVPPAKISKPPTPSHDQSSSGEMGAVEILNVENSSDSDEHNRKISLLLLSKPILALEFSSMQLKVGAPRIVEPR
ncbi:protein NEOXANTHIN-DEFICIENT 1 isoform X3 [Amborella trichopoda]|uniref:protein NEOXANTHIN-DEFICIENT 1 isoform X3 n=1 Tax=Amborella trichopoda TaxID=13333 RepID=UPI0009BE18C1|nr:protein NEOXANTHIN-DEFICIENT 1 isoform X3 [Amborella trichopoda]|eukprot:XP_020529023.1 protein NEOXANTHIN-DEFICIENT 1 isoform X3 [Amborella trichopoda]